MRGQFQMRTRRDGSLEYGYQYTDPTDGHRKWYWGSAAQCAGFKRKVEIARQELRLELTSRAVVRAQLPGHADPHHVKLADVFDRYLLTLPKRARATAESTWKHQIDVGGLGRQIVFDLTPEFMAHWSVTLKSEGGRGGAGRAPKTIMNAYTYLTAAIRKILGLEKLPWGDWKPFSTTKVEPKNPREAVQSFEQLIDLVKKARERDARLWSQGKYADRSIAITVAGLTAMRNAELAGLGWDDCRLDVEPYLLTVRYQAPRGWVKDQPGQKRPTIPTKNRRVHQQIPHESVRLALVEQREQLRRLGWYRDDGPVFPCKRERLTIGRWRTSGRVLDPRTVRRTVKAAGLPNAHRWCAHSLRHSATTLENQAQRGDLRATALRTGHRDLRVMEGYLHQLGVGMPRSAIPEIPAGYFTRAVDTDGADTTRPPPLLPPRDVPSDPWGLSTLTPPGDLSLTFSAEIEALHAKKQRETKRRRVETERPFDELAREWIAELERSGDGVVRDIGGRALPRPHAVTDAARRKGANNYQRTKYSGKPTIECQKAWKRGKIAVLARWAGVLKAERDKLAADRVRRERALGAGCPLAPEPNHDPVI